MAQRDAALELVHRESTAEGYRKARARWTAHSIAEDARDISGLLATLTDDSVYDVVPTGHHCHGLEGAPRFYTELLTAFPDITIELSHIVIGPGGGLEEADVTATHAADRLDFRASGARITFAVVSYLPWDATAGKFSGERVYLHTAPLRAGIAAPS